MSFVDNGNGNGFYMPVAPAGGYGYGNGGGFGNGFGDNGAFWLLVLLFALGGNGWGNGFGNAGGAMPYVLNNNTDNAVQRGFDQSAVMNGITNLTSNVCNGNSDILQAICNSTAGITASINNGFSTAEVADNARQMANMQQQFTNQMATNTGFNNLASQLAQCCCDNRLATANLTSTILSENCADRAAVTDGVRDILANQNAGIQRILDQMCNDKIDAKNEKIADLERQLTMANFAASQASQTQDIENFVRPPINPTYNVPNPYAYYGNNGCGCGNF